MGLFGLFGGKPPLRRIVRLERLSEGQALRVLLWADVPPDYQRFWADPNATSAFLDATDAELKALKAGQLAERVETVTTVSMQLVADPSEREVLNDADPNYGLMKVQAFSEQWANKALTPDAYELAVPRYVKQTGVLVKTFVDWDEATLTQGLEDVWQRWQDEVDAGFVRGADFSRYGVDNEAADASP